MKRILKRGKHLLRAKGRHGTHSPFVYAFVEQVMRSRQHFTIHATTGILTEKQINLTGRAIRYLNPPIVYADAALLETIRQIASTPNVLATDTSKQDYLPETCFVCIPTTETVRFLTELAIHQVCTAIIPLDHTNPAAVKQWETLQESADFKMVLDAWHIGLASNHPDFKIKQYFRLR